MAGCQTQLDGNSDKSVTLVKEAVAGDTTKKQKRGRRGGKRLQKKRRKLLGEEQVDADQSEDSEQETEQDSKSTKRPKKIRPNFFVAWKISKPEIHSGIKSVQDAIVAHTEALKGAVIPLETLHITLMVMHLEGDEQIENAKSALEKCKTGFCSILEKESGEIMAGCESDTETQGNLDHKTESVITSQETSAPEVMLTFSGLDHFGHKVLFAKLSSQHEISLLKSVASVVRENFISEGILSTDNREFQPHLTVMKMSREPRLREKGIMKIPEESYSAFRDVEFGKEPLTQLHLCSMTHPKENGFYKVFGTLRRFSPRITLK